MSSQRDDDDDTRPVVWAVLIGAIVLAVGLALGFGIAKSMKGAKGASGAVSTAAVAAGPADGASAAGAAAGAQGLQLRDDESRVVVEGGVVKFYFASGKADLADGADQALGDVIAAVNAGAGYGVAKQTIVPAILGIVFALVFAIGPGVIDGMLTATI